jgi:hypothetical protein
MIGKSGVCTAAVAKEHDSEALFSRTRPLLFDAVLLFETIIPGGRFLALALPVKRRSCAVKLRKSHDNAGNHRPLASPTATNCEPQRKSTILSHGDR